MQVWKQKVRQLKKETYAIYLAGKDPRTPWYAKLLAACVVAYAFSPIDLIPDFIPILGYLDDLIIVPLGIWLVLRLIPSAILEKYRERAAALMKEGKPIDRTAAIVIVTIWVLLGISIAVWIGSVLKR